MSEDTPLPWEHTRSPLALAFTRAWDRADALAEPDAELLFTSPGAPGPSMLMGTDADPVEMNAYMVHTARIYLALMNDRPDDAVAILTGCGIVSFLIGSMHARAVASPSAGSTLAGSPEGLTAAAAPLAHIGRVPTIAERAELTRDSVQWVLDLECDRLERTAMTLQALGLERPANLMRAAAIIIRQTLETAGDGPDH